MMATTEGFWREGGKGKRVRTENSTLPSDVGMDGGEGCRRSRVYIYIYI
jgi:hypothetical protein